jgi:uncharacterized protein
MKIHRPDPRTVAVLVGFLIIGVPSFSQAKAAVPALGGLSGRWIGAFTGEGDPLAFELTIFPGGALFSVPAQKVYGMPVAGIGLKGNDLQVTVSAADPEIRLSGTVDGEAIAGDFLNAGKAVFRFSMKRSVLPKRSGTDVRIKVSTGVFASASLPGTLVLPDAEKFPGARPLALILADSGPTDRDGNNHSMPGKNDCLLQLAESLAQQGIASLRYDKRGAGESYPLAPDEGSLVFEDYVKDAVAALNQFRGDKRFSRIILLGHGEGSTVGMLAARQAKADGFVSIAGPGLPAWRLIQDQLAALPVEAGEDRPAREKAWNAIIDSLKAGKKVAVVPDDLLSLFRPKVQPYLISWFAVDPKAEIGKLACPIQLIQGGNDLRVGPEDTKALSEGAKTAREAFIPDMNHVLKNVMPLDQDNWTAYSDPAYPLASGIAGVIAQFIAEKLGG